MTNRSRRNPPLLLLAIVAMVTVAGCQFVDYFIQNQF
jgi:hypothetical protein